jgi:outer membrane protein with beta-barrel domain
MRCSFNVLCALATAWGSAATASAQNPAVVAIRPFGEVAIQRFSATQTFTAVFGESTGWFFGGGLDVTVNDRLYFELSASRFQKTGDQVYFDAPSGHPYHLNIPLQATLTPLEATGGYRFHPRAARWLIPFLGGGAGRFSYREACTAATAVCAAVGPDLDLAHAGFVADGGAEFRVHKWVGVAADFRYTYVTGILGTAGVSADLNEKDLGGIAGRFKIVVGR